MKKQKKILVVEDESDMLLLLSIRLEVNDYHVVKASDGEEALHQVEKENPDLIILDIMLPKIDGFKVCGMLKFDDRTKKIPIIVLSALGMQQDRDKAIQSGADAYFIKPFDLELLLTKIKSLIQ